MGATATAQAQVTPTTPQRGGIMNQTTVPAASPTNPGTIDQRTPTTTNPTQMSTGSPTQIGTSTIDQAPIIQRSGTTEQRVDQRTGTVVQPTTTQPTNTSVNLRRETVPSRRTTETTTPRP